MAQSTWPIAAPDASVGGEKEYYRSVRSRKAAGLRRQRGQFNAAKRILVLGAYSIDNQHKMRTACAVARYALDGGQPLPLLAESPAAIPTQGFFWQLSYARLTTHSLVLLIILMALFGHALPLDVPGRATAYVTPSRAMPAPVSEGIILVARAPGLGVEPGEISLPEQQIFLQSAEGAFIEYHTLQEGETLGDIAARYGVDVASLYWANDLQGDTVISAGHELRIPRLAGMPYIIQPEDSLTGIAEQFHVAVEAITLFQANGIKPGDALEVGQEIFIPGATQAYPEELLKRVGGVAGVARMQAVVSGSVYESDTNLRAGPGRSYPRVAYLDAGIHLQPIARHEQWVKVDAGSEGSGWVRADMIALSEATFQGLPITNDFPPLPPRWIWPSSGAFTSSFGWRTSPFRSFHNGIDIANRAGTPIVAARAGRVVQAGWCSGYGYCVRINHGEGIETTYGHMLRKPSVAVGDQVEAGDLIGLMGSTFDRAGGGYSTGVHLHFTIKINGQAVNPMSYLP